MGRKFTQSQLNDIMEQGMIQQCACPALLTRLLSDARYLNEYQKTCQSDSENDQRVHAAIARATDIVSSILEDYLIDILVLEEWETETLQMPERLVKLQMDAVDRDKCYALAQFSAAG